MASSFRLKRKLYSSDKEGSSFGKKALAIGGTLAATAGAFYGAKKGMFGAGAQKWAGSTYGKIGKAVGSDNMMLSGANSYGQGVAKQMANHRDALIKAGTSKNAAYTNEQMTANASKAGNAFLGKLLK